MFLWEVDGRRVALPQVPCNGQFLTPDELMSADSGVVSYFGGTISQSSAAPIEVAGVEGMRNMYAFAPGGLAVEHVVVYLPGDECGWGIGLSPFGVGSRGPLISLFNEIIDSFRFD